MNWQQYEVVLAKLQDNNYYRVAYLDGVLEIVSPSIRHEKLKKRLATLVEFYLIRKRIKHTLMGSPTVRKRLKRAGAEPDECYCIGEEKSIPDLAIEVVITSATIDKLETYRGLEFIEVWMWKVNRLTLYQLREETPLKFKETHEYEQITSSELLPDLNIALVEQCVMISDQIQAIDEFEQGIS